LYYKLRYNILSLEYNSILIMGEYSWLSEYQRTWEEVKLAQDPIKEENHETLHLRPLLRKFVLVLDYSKSASKKDFKPSRHKLISQLTETFNETFYSYNPLSKLQIIVARDGKAACATSKSQLSISPEGDFSLQNSLDLSLKTLEDTGPHWSSEILIILNSLTTCDPEDVWESLYLLQSNYIRLHVISTCAEFFTLKEYTRQTGGKWIIAEDESRLKEHWETFAKNGYPASSAALIPMAFSWASPVRSPCGCHLEMNEGYICPVCGCKVCTLPIKCPVCKYILVSVPHLTKASLSMSPLPPFAPGSGVCTGCDRNAEYQCTKCNNPYCNTCQDFLRASLGKCIGCSFV
jgi:transcription initiation factor TFIIH subunit 2